MNNSISRFLAALMMMLLISMPLFASQTGDIEGTVLDPSGAVVSDAKISVRNVASGAVRTVMTNSLGQFAVLQLALGDYEVSIEKSGFRTAVSKTTVRIGEKSRVDLKLALGSTSEAVEVEASAVPVLDVATSQLSTTLESKQVLALPNLGRDLVAFSTLAPGTAPVSKDNPFLGTGSFNSNGSRGRANNITVDNVFSTDISTTGSSGLGTFSIDAIQEFKVVTNNFSAEDGRNSGAQVQIITKTGGNSYHGTVSWAHQNSAFNARDYFDTTGKATPSINNDWGFYLGGPIIKNKLFVSGHYEGNKIRGAGSSSVANVLTPAQAAAITDPTSRALFAAVGAPTDPSGKLTSAAANAANTYSWSLKVDSNLTKNDILSVDYGANPNSNVRPGLVFINTHLPNYGAHVVSEARKAYVSETHTFSPTVVNQFRFSFGRSNPTFSPFTTLTAPFASEVLISGFDALGESNILPQGRVQNTFQYTDTVSWFKGRHSLKFGVDADRYQANSFFDANFRGTASFGSVANFQAGIPNGWSERFGTSRRYNLSLDVFSFVQDDFRITPNLTLNLGVRMESSGGVSEKTNLLSNLDSASNAPVGGGGTGPLGGIDLGGTSFGRNYNWAPRLGFAWNPKGGKLVVRGGYGIAYDFIYLNPITNLRFAAPFIPSISLNAFTGTNTLANLVAGNAQAQTDAIAAIGQFLPTQKNFGTLSPVQQNLQNPRNMQYSLGVEYEVIKNLALKVGYVGSRNDHLQASVPINLVNAAVVPAPATSDADEAARLASFTSVFRGESGNATGTVVNNRLDPRFDSVVQVQSIGTSNYNSLQLEAVRTFSHGLSVDASYTWAHSIDDISDALGVLVNDSSGFQDPRNLKDNRANSQFDLRHRFVLSYYWQIPWTNRFTGIAGKALDGWGVAGIISNQGGLPSSIFAGTRRGIGDNLLDGNSTARANGDIASFNPVPIGSAAAALIPAPCARGVNTSTSAATICTNTSGFGITQPLLGNAGTSGRNALRLGGYADTDISIIKDTKLTERVSLRFRWEMFNLFNHPNFSGFQNNLTSSNFGTYSSTASDMRKMQGGFKLIF